MVQYQHCFPRAGDLGLITNFWEFEEWVVESIHVEFVASYNNLNPNDRTQKSNILDH